MVTVIPDLPRFQACAVGHGTSILNNKGFDMGNCIKP
jgi:hypothetical protein